MVLKTSHPVRPRAMNRMAEGFWDTLNLLTEHGEDLRRQAVCTKVAMLAEKPMPRSKLTEATKELRVLSKRKRPRPAAYPLYLGMLHARHEGFDLQMPGLDLHPLTTVRCRSTPPVEGFGGV